MTDVQKGDLQDGLPPRSAPGWTLEQVVNHRADEVEATRQLVVDFLGGHASKADVRIDPNDPDVARVRVRCHRNHYNLASNTKGGKFVIHLHRNGSDVYFTFTKDGGTALGGNLSERLTPEEVLAFFLPDERDGAPRAGSGD